MTALFSVRGVSYLDILHYPELDIKKGQTTFIAGESGSGKSTLLKLLNATLSPTTGQVCYLGQDLAGMDTLVLRREVILVAQDAWLFPGSIKENFTQFRAFRGDKPLSAEEIKALLTTCALEMPLDKDSKTLSGGERQRVFLAICLSFAPKVLLMDEPTSALDEQTAHLLFTRLAAYARENSFSLVVVSHAKTLAQDFADQVITFSGRDKA